MRMQQRIVALMQALVAVYPFFLSGVALAQEPAPAAGPVVEAMDAPAAPVAPVIPADPVTPANPADLVVVPSSPPGDALPTTTSGPAEGKAAPMLDRMGDALLKMKRDVGKKEKDITSGVKKILKDALPLVGGETATDAAVAASQNVETDADSVQNQKTQSSIMYGESDIGNLRKVLEAYESRRKQETQGGSSVGSEDGTIPSGAAAGQGDGFIDSLIQNIQGEQGGAENGGGAGGGMAASAQSFYLDSIMYMSSGSWAVWINGQKFSHDERESGQATAHIKIEDISREKVRFSWEVGNVDAISPYWQEKVALLGDKDAQDRAIVVDPKTQTVYVTLRPNQTFISRAMEIVEGQAGNYTPAPTPMPAGASGTQDIRNIPIGTPEPPEPDDQSALPDKDMMATVGALVGKKGQPVDERAIADGLTDVYKGIGKGMGIVPPEQE